MTEFDDIPPEFRRMTWAELETIVSGGDPAPILRRVNSHVKTEAPLYIEYAGQKYVRLDHAIEELEGSAKDALEASARLIQGYPAISTDVALRAAADIRSLKNVITNPLTHERDERGKLYVTINDGERAYFDLSDDPRFNPERKDNT